jgi:HD superfamily phosphohydrolase
MAVKESEITLDSNMLIHDSIHGSFGLPKLAWTIIDTPVFQRLRLIKQTGNTFYVYMGAEHTRFQHSLGVAYLSLEFGKTIKSRYPELITNRQILLLCIAGLCHDLGHCAYSHLYDHNIIPKFKLLNADSDSDSRGSNCISTHEEASYRLLQELWRSTPALHVTLTEDDICTIGKMILGAEDKIPASLTGELVWSTYDKANQFLYDIVSNDRTGIDVDKFDYLKRDSHYTGIPCTFDPQRLMAFFFIAERDGTHYLDYHTKSNELINAMWVSRDDLHRRVYQHRVVKCIDLMTIEMIMLCKDEPLDPLEPDGCLLRKAHHTTQTYRKLTDRSITALAERVPKAKAILNRILSRQLWKTIATVTSTNKLNMSFIDPNIKVSSARFRDSHVYYVFHTGNKQLNSLFFLDLIVQAKGNAIHIRKSVQIQTLFEEIIDPISPSTMSGSDLGA